MGVGLKASSMLVSAGNTQYPGLVIIGYYMLLDQIEILKTCKFMLLAKDIE